MKEINKNFFNKYLKIILKGSGAISIAELSVKLIGFILLPIFTIYLSPNEYGLISLTMLIVTFLNLLYNPGIISASLRLYHATDSESERRNIIGSSFMFILFFSFCFSIFVIIFGRNLFSYISIDLDFYPYVIIALILAFFTQIKRLWVALMSLLFKVEITAYYSVIAAIIGVFFSVLFVVFLEMGAVGRLIGFIPSSIFLFVISCKMILTFSKKYWSFSKIKEVLAFGFPLILAIWSYEILHVADRLIIEQMIGVTALGIYSFSYTIAETQRFIFIGVSKLWDPIFYENMNEKRYDVIKNLILSFIAILSIINLLIILFNKELILTLIDSRYFDSIDLISIIVLGLYFNGLLIIFTSSLSFKNKFSSISKIAVISSILNVIMNIILIPYLGLIGCALATAASYFIYFLICFIAERKTIKDFLNVPFLVSSILFIIFAVVISYFTNNIEISLIEIFFKIFYIITYVLFCFFIYKKNLITF